MQLTHVVKSLIIKYLNWVYFGYIHLWGLVMLVRRTSLRFSSQFESRSDKLPEWVPVGKLVKCAGVTVWYSTVGVPLCRFNCAKAGEGEAWICVCILVCVCVCSSALYSDAKWVCGHMCFFQFSMQIYRKQQCHGESSSLCSAQDRMCLMSMQVYVKMNMLFGL